MTKFKKGKGDGLGHKLASKRKDLARQIRGTPKQLRQTVHTKQGCNYKVYNGLLESQLSEFLELKYGKSKRLRL